MPYLLRKSSSCEPRKLPESQGAERGSLAPHWTETGCAGMTHAQSLLGGVCPRSGGQRPCIPEPWPVMGPPLWLLDKRRESSTVSPWAAPRPHLALTGAPDPFSPSLAEDGVRVHNSF